MKITKKSIAALLACLIMALPVVALAQYAAPTDTQLPGASVYDIIKGVMQWILAIVGIIGVIGFAIAGILYLTAAGDETQIDKAKKAMTYSIIGVIVALFGLVALTAVENMLKGSEQF